MATTELKGIITPILTPMNPDETINTEELRKQIDRLIDGKVHGIFPFGTNGEGYILSEKEKCEVSPFIPTLQRKNWHRSQS